MFVCVVPTHYFFPRMKSLQAVLVVLVVAMASLVAARFKACTCPEEVNVNCPVIGEDAVFFPHPEHCTMYCECEMEGCASALTCPPDLVFDPVLNVCSWPDTVSIFGSFISVPSAVVELSWGLFLEYKR